MEPLNSFTVTNTEQAAQPTAMPAKSSGIPFGAVPFTFTTVAVSVLADYAMM